MMAQFLPRDVRASLAGSSEVSIDDVAGGHRAGNGPWP
jgi:hypothetical protein